MHCPRTDGLCRRAAAASSWHAKQILFFGIDRLTSVISPCVEVTWQTSQGDCIAECTDVPFVFFAWQEVQSASLPSDPGCSTAFARVTVKTPMRRLAAANALAKVIGRVILKSCGNQKHY